MARTKSGEKKKRQQSVQKREQEDEFEVEKIVEVKGKGKNIQYMVKWKNYPDSDNTWESASDLPKNIITAFEKKQAKSPKKSPKKAATPKPKPKEKKPVVVTGRKLLDNVVHYEVKGRQKAIPIYDFDDFQPIYDYELDAPNNTADDEGGLKPARILERKGTKYLVLWQGKAQQKSWETTKNLICVPLMKEFDEKEEEDSEDEIYEVKSILDKRKNGRVYEYKVLWKGSDEDNCTWEPAENLESCSNKIRAYDKEEARKLEQAKQKKAKQAADRAEKRASAGGEGSPAKRGRPGKA